MGKGQSISSLMPGYTADQPNVKILPKVDVRKVLEEDRKKDSQLPRFGVKIPVGFTEQDGQWYDKGRYSIWKLQVYSQRAISLSFQFTNLNLSKGSEIWLYSEDRNMIQGPILPEYVHNGILPTDQVFGEKATISITIPRVSKDSFSIRVENVIHGVKRPELQVRGYGDSDSCNVNIVCSPEGDNWLLEKDAVCRIIIGNGNASGFLVNNACQDLDPFILTANYILDVPKIEPLDNWVFRFGYESPTCFNTEPTSWLSFFGADHRASWSNSDFALLELRASLVGYEELALAGWNRNSSVPNSSSIIHHPKGDVKKITYDDSLATIETSPPPGSTFNSGMAFRLNLSPGNNNDYGIVESGSSGAPHFNEDRRIVGQHLGIYGILNCTSTFNSYEGRFHNSWTGGGNNNNRLSNWLGGNGNPTTTNTIRIPSVAGDKEVCPGDIETYTLQDPIPGKTITWEVSPASAASISSGSGSSANISWKSDFDGYASLSFIHSESGCNNVGIPIEIRVGTPRNISQAFNPVNQTYVSNPVINKQYEFHAITPYTSSSSGDYNWTVTPPSGGGFPTIHQGKEINYTASVSGTHTFELKINGYCGWSSIGEKDINFNSPSSLADFQVKVFPNPSSNVLYLKYSKNKLKSTDNTMVLKIYSSHGQLTYEDKNYLPGKPIPIDNMKSGIYKIIVQDHKNRNYETFVKE